MNLRDKRIWLTEYGFYAWHGIQTDGMYSVAWSSHGTYDTIVVGETKDKMYENLFDNVKEDLYQTCCDAD